MRRLLPSFFLLACLVFAAEKQKVLKPGWNLFKPADDVRMGQEYAQQVERQFQVVSNPEVQNYVAQIGQRLVNAIEGEKFPFTFKVVNDPSINAFALPGGPMFVHTGLIAAADNEAQIAGVLGHEMGHVMLRHGTNQASKANLIQIPAMIAGGVFGDGSMAGSLAQLGITLGANSVLLRFSRSAENEADLYGARLMHRAGYNPVELARFFEKLESGAAKSGAFQQMFSDHPNPGNRVKSIEADMKFLNQRTYQGSAVTPELARSREVIKTLPPPPKKAAGQQSGSQAPPVQGPAVVIQPPAGFKAHQTPIYAMIYPDDWRATPAQDNVSATLAAADGVVRGANAQEDVGHGVLIGFGKPQSSDLAQATGDLIQGMQQGNSGLRTAGAVQSVDIDGLRGRITPLEGRSSLRPNEKENILVLTVMNSKGLFYGIFIAPESRWHAAEPEYRQMMQSLRFKR